MSNPFTAVCVDASVGAKWFLRDEQDNRAALELFERGALGEFDLVVPDLFFAEIGNVLLTSLRRGRLSESLVLDHLAELARLHLESVTVRDELDSTLSFARRFGLAFYDASYLAVAESRGALLVTCDEKILAVASRELDWVLTPDRAIARIAPRQDS